MAAESAGAQAHSHCPCVGSSCRPSASPARGRSGPASEGPTARVPLFSLFYCPGSALSCCDCWVEKWILACPFESRGEFRCRVGPLRATSCPPAPPACTENTAGELAAAAAEIGRAHV